MTAGMAGRSSARRVSVADALCGLSGQQTDERDASDEDDRGDDYVVLVAIDRDQNSVADYNITGAIRLATLKLVGYTEVAHSLLGRLVPGAAIVMFGGQAKDLPYPGSTTVSTVNGGIEGLVRTLVHELKPIRVNCLHPGIVGNSPYWETRPAALAATLARTPTDRLTTIDDIVGGVAFLLENNGVNGVNLKIDGGLHCM
jgi:NAD(P)-dependent dehydrogenase (short-subunit alcohol dehydrogenase family)